MLFPMNQTNTLAPTALRDYLDYVYLNRNSNFGSILDRIVPGGYIHSRIIEFGLVNEAQLVVETLSVIDTCKSQATRMNPYFATAVLSFFERNSFEQAAIQFFLDLQTNRAFFISHLLLSRLSIDFLLVIIARVFERLISTEVLKASTVKTKSLILDDLFLEVLSYRSTRIMSHLLGVLLCERIRIYYAGSSLTSKAYPNRDPRICIAFQSSIHANNQALKSSFIYSNVSSSHKSSSVGLSGCRPSSSSKPYALDNQPVSRSKNLLFISPNFNFLRQDIFHIDSSGEFHVKTYCSSMGLFKECIPDVQVIGSAALGNNGSAYLSGLICPRLAQLIGWADCIFVEWCAIEAVLISCIVPSHKKIIVRLHSYEAFSGWIHYVQWTKIGGLICIAPTLMNYVEMQIGEGVAHIHKRVIYNSQSAKKVLGDLDDSHLRISKLTQVAIGMLGYTDSNKDPIFVLESIKELANLLSLKGVRLILKLAGNDFKPRLSSFEDAYRQRFISRLDAISRNIEVEISGYISEPEQLAVWFRGIDFMFSSSQREGSHEAIIEGTAHGCIPILRDWPMMKRLGGVRSVYPYLSDYVVETPDEACTKILEIIDKGLPAIRLNMSSVYKQRHGVGCRSEEMLDFIKNVLGQ